MARGRMVSKSIGTSWKFAQCGEAAGEFPQLLFLLLVAHADDFGRLPGDAFTIMKRIFPTSTRSVMEFSNALDALVSVGLIARYLADNRWVIQVVRFDEHQQGLHKRTASEFPDPPGSSGNVPEIPGQGKGREGNLREPKYSTSPQNGDCGKAVENSKTKAGKEGKKLFRQLLAIAHTVIEDGDDRSQWVEDMKQRCFMQNVPTALPNDQNNTPAYRRALLMAEAVRVKRGQLQP